MSTIFDKEMQAALEADGEYLRQMTGDDHGPFFLVACEACGGEGLIFKRATVYEAGCAIPHDDTEERECKECDGDARDYEEGMNGRVYRVCGACIKRVNDEAEAELRAYDDWDDHDPSDWEDEDCWNCGGEGYISDFFDCMCEDADSGCDQCTRRCDVCNPAKKVATP